MPVAKVLRKSAAIGDGEHALEFHRGVDAVRALFRK